MFFNMIIVISYIPHFIVIVQHIKTKSEATYNLKIKVFHVAIEQGWGTLILEATLLQTLAQPWKTLE